MGLVTLSLCVQLAIAKNNIIKLQEENQQLRSENNVILLKAQQHFEVRSHIFRWGLLLLSLLGLQKSVNSFISGPQPPAQSSPSVLS